MIYCRKYEINVGGVQKGFQQRPHVMKRGHEQVHELEKPIHSQLQALIVSQR
jgi:hypothetical protein